MNRGIHRGNRRERGRSKCHAALLCRCRQTRSTIPVRSVLRAMPRLPHHALLEPLLGAISHWIEKRRRRWVTFVGSRCRSLPAPAEPTCCLFCDFEGHFAGEAGAALADRGTDRLLTLLDALRLRITFNVVADLCRSHPQRVTRIRDAGHEIACHGYRHERPRDLPGAQIDTMMQRAVACFAELAIRPTGFRSPESAWSMSLLPALTRHGFRWNAERDPSTRPYRIASGLIRFPVRTDDWDLTDDVATSDPARAICKLLDKWSSHSHASAHCRGLLLIGVHEWIFGLRGGYGDALEDWIGRCRRECWHFQTIGDVAGRLTPTP